MQLHMVSEQAYRKYAAVGRHEGARCSHGKNRLSFITLRAPWS